MTALLKNQDKPFHKLFFITSQPQKLLMQNSGTRRKYLCHAFSLTRYRGGLLKNLEIRTPEACACHKLGLMGQSERSFEYQRMREVQAVKAWFMRFQSRTGLSHLCYILTRNLVAFCWCPENFCEAEFKCNERNHLAEGVLTQYNIMRGAVVVHRTWEAEVGGSLSSGLVWSTE